MPLSEELERYLHASFGESPSEFGASFPSHSNGHLDAYMVPEQTLSSSPEPPKHECAILMTPLHDRMYTRN